MRLDFLAPLVITGLCAMCSVAMATNRQKRQGLFMCSGWGASCSSGWKSVVQPEKPTVQKFQAPEPKPQSVYHPTRTRFWLTTEKAWGPMGKRGELNSNILQALLQQSLGKQDKTS